jgi:hypothetical protein
MQWKAMQSNAKQSKAKQCNAKQCKAKQSKAKQSKALQNNAKPSQAKPPKFPKSENLRIPKTLYEQYSGKCHVKAPSSCEFMQAEGSRSHHPVGSSCLHLHLEHCRGRNRVERWQSALLLGAASLHGMGRMASLARRTAAKRLQHTTPTTNCLTQGHFQRVVLRMPPVVFQNPLMSLPVVLQNPVMSLCLLCSTILDYSAPKLKRKNFTTSG